VSASADIYEKRAQHFLVSASAGFWARFVKLERGLHRVLPKTGAIYYRLVRVVAYLQGFHLVKTQKKLRCARLFFALRAATFMGPFGPKSPQAQNT
jgi:hypothetical protein